ncbi:hypothetical protein CGRA01v4_04843 [Colletotrichum graminicola]|nr:hypothetical protein CGRA01v4_04843 [Colletotrichum graminicola]
MRPSLGSDRATCLTLLGIRAGLLNNAPCQAKSLDHMEQVCLDSGDTRLLQTLRRHGLKGLSAMVVEQWYSSCCLCTGSSRSLTALARSLRPK